MRPDFRPSPELYPFESRWFESSVGLVHYVDEGEGRPILFLHANATWSFLYRGIISRLRDRFRCVAPDCPGFGLSDRPAGYAYTWSEHAAVISELVDHLGLDELIVMGHDGGGPIGLRVALSAPDRVTGIVLGNTWFWPPHQRSMRLFARIMATRPLQWAILRRNLFVERVIPASTARKLTWEEMDHYRDVQPTPELRVGIARWPREILAAEPLLSELAREVPRQLGSKSALLVWGMRDPWFRASAYVPRIRAAFFDCMVVELPKAKLFIQEDAPQEIARAITERFG
ncbi:MAG: alpha/beta fold hydrolase [Armatimonadetes bacterium]|nr:alpha/beta fold hydrolase [Armatimonadota bacterium]